MYIYIYRYIDIYIGETQVLCILKDMDFEARFEIRKRFWHKTLIYRHKKEIEKRKKKKRFR